MAGYPPPGTGYPYSSSSPYDSTDRSTKDKGKHGSGSESQSYGAPPPGQSYGAPPPGQSYGAPPPGQSYGAPPPGQSYGAPPPGQSYGAPPPGQSYGAPPSGQSYGAPPPGQSYGAPPSGQSYGSPPPGQSYGAPPPSAPYAGHKPPKDQHGYGAPPPGQSYGAPPPSAPYDKPPKDQYGYGAPPPGQGYGSSGSSYGAPGQGYGAPGQGYGAPGQGAPGQGYGAPGQGAPSAPYGSPFASLAPSAFPSGMDPNVVACFQAADRDGSGFIDDRELQGALSSYNQSFSIRTVHLLMYLFTGSNVHRIGPKEFASVFYSLQSWRQIFEQFDRDRSGKIDTNELREALLSLGFSVSPTVLELLVSKFDKTGGHQRAIEYDNFIECCLTVKGLTEKFKEKDTSFQGSATFTYESFMLTVLPFLIA